MSIKTLEIKCVSLKDQTLNTGLQRIRLVEGEVFSTYFKSFQHFRQYTDIGVIAEAPKDVEVKKVIPILKMPKVLITEDGQELPLSSVDVPSTPVIPQEPINCEGCDEYTKESAEKTIEDLPKLKEITIEYIEP